MLTRRRNRNFLFKCPRWSKKAFPNSLVTLADPRPPDAELAAGILRYEKEFPAPGDLAAAVAVARHRTHAGASVAILAPTFYPLGPAAPSVYLTLGRYRSRYGLNRAILEAVFAHYRARGASGYAVSLPAVYGAPLRAAVLVEAHLGEQLSVVVTDRRSGKTVAEPYLCELDDPSLGRPYHWHAAVDGGSIPDELYLKRLPPGHLVAGLRPAA